MTVRGFPVPDEGLALAALGNQTQGERRLTFDEVGAGGAVLIGMPLGVIAWPCPNAKQDSDAPRDLRAVHLDARLRCHALTANTISATTTTATANTMAKKPRKVAAEPSASRYTMAGVWPVVHPLAAVPLSGQNLRLAPKQSTGNG